MGLFRRSGHAAPTPSTGHHLDDQLLGQLAARSDMNSPRHWIHYLYCADQNGAEQAAARIADAGWSIQRADGAADGSGWVVIAEQDDVVLTAQRVTAARAFFEQVASSTAGGDYDGWEASV